MKNDSNQTKAEKIFDDRVELKCPLKEFQAAAIFKSTVLLSEPPYGSKQYQIFHGRLMVWRKEYCAGAKPQTVIDETPVIVAVETDKDNASMTRAAVKQADVWTRLCRQRLAEAYRKQNPKTKGKVVRKSKVKRAVNIASATA